MPDVCWAETPAEAGPARPPDGRRHLRHRRAHRRGAKRPSHVGAARRVPGRRGRARRPRPRPRRVVARRPPSSGPGTAAGHVRRRGDVRAAGPGCCRGASRQGRPRRHRRRHPWSRAQPAEETRWSPPTALTSRRSRRRPASTSSSNTRECAVPRQAVRATCRVRRAAAGGRPTPWGCQERRGRGRRARRQPRWPWPGDPTDSGLPIRWGWCCTGRWRRWCSACRRRSHASAARCRRRRTTRQPVRRGPPCWPPPR